MNYEKICYRYISALERGDFATIAMILTDAQLDPMLEAMLLEINEEYAMEINIVRVGQIKSVNKQRYRWVGVAAVLAVIWLALLFIIHLRNQTRITWLMQPPVDPVVVSPENVYQLAKLESFGQGTVFGAAWSPDESKLVLATSVGLRLYESPAFDHYTLITSEAARTAAFSPDGTYLVSGGAFGLRSWNVQTWKVIDEWETSDSVYGKLTFSPDGKLLLFIQEQIKEDGSYFSLPTLMDLVADKTIPLAVDDITSAAFSPNSTLLALGNYFDATLTVWDVSQEVPTVRFEKTDYTVSTLTFAPDGQTLGVMTTAGISYTSFQSAIQLWNVETWEQVGEKEIERANPSMFSFLDAERVLFAAVEGNDFIYPTVWTIPDDSTSKARESIATNTVFLGESLGYAAAFLSRTTGDLEIWNTSDLLHPELITSLQDFSSYLPIGFTFSAPGTTQAAMLSYSGVEVWDYRTHELLFIDKPLTQLGWSRLVANPESGFTYTLEPLTAPITNTVYTWTGERSRHVLANFYRIAGLGYDADHQLLVFGDNLTYQPTLLQGATSHLIEIPPTSFNNKTYSDALFSNDGMYMAVKVCSDPCTRGSYQVQLINILTKDTLLIEDFFTAFLQGTFYSSEERHVVALGGCKEPVVEYQCSQREIRVWELVNNEALEMFRVADDAGPYGAMTFSPDGKLLALVNRIGKLQIYSIEGELLNSIPVNNMALIDFTPDGTRLGIMVDGLIELWGVE